MFKLLPHYKVGKDKIVFLDRSELDIAITPAIGHILNHPADRTVTLNKQEEVTMQRLYNVGILYRPAETRTSNEKKKVALFIQPHSDDCALSCGGIMALMNDYSIRCETIFSNYSTKGFPLRETINISDEEYSGLRRMEDESAFDYLGGKIRFSGLDEALLRGLRFPIVKGGVFKKDRSLLKAIETVLDRAIKRTQPKKLFLPMAVGNHYDHILVAASARNLLSTYGKEIDFFFYEDYPYCDEDRCGLWNRLGIVGQEHVLTPMYYDIGDFLIKKATLINFYKTQFFEWSFQLIKKKITNLSRCLAFENNHLSRRTLPFENAQRVWKISLN
jgi:LmbE family N-acetylglucosaminyl deacetylase